LLLLGFFELDIGINGGHSAVSSNNAHADSTDSHRYASDTHVSVRVLQEEFKSLVDRICELTPNQKAIAEETRAILQEPMWRQLLLGESVPDEAKGAVMALEDRKILFQKIVMNTAMALWRVASFEQQIIIRSHINVMMPRIASMSEDMPNINTILHRAEALYLSMSHEIVDDIERQVSKVLEEYETQHDKRRLAYRESHAHHAQHK
jgi:hypothetical protein